MVRRGWMDRRLVPNWNSVRWPHRYIIQDTFKIGDPILHIELRRWADIVLIAPCSANTLSKIAHGLCDNLVVRSSTSHSNRWPEVIATTDVSSSCTCTHYSNIRVPSHEHTHVWASAHIRTPSDSARCCALRSCWSNWQRSGMWWCWYVSGSYRIIECWFSCRSWRNDRMAGYRENCGGQM